MMRSEGNHVLLARVGAGWRWAAMLAAVGCWQHREEQQRTGVLLFRVLRTGSESHPYSVRRRRKDGRAGLVKGGLVLGRFTASE